MLKEIEKYLSVKKNNLFTTDVAMKCKEEATDGEIECYFRTVRKNRGLLFQYYNEVKICSCFVYVWRGV